MAEQSNGFSKSLILIGVIIIIIIVGGASYFYTASQNAAMPTNSTIATAPGNVTTTNGATNMTMSTGTNMTTSSNTNATMTNMTSANVSIITIQQNATTQHYKVTLQVGPPAQMIAMNQTATATEGEVMVGGQILNMTSMNETDAYHLEAHVYNITNGLVMTNQNVSIQILNRSTNQTQNVPVVVMYDMKIGTSDTHFGNNVTLLPGSYTIIVKVGSETATFDVTVTDQ